MNVHPYFRRSRRRHPEVTEEIARQVSRNAVEEREEWDLERDDVRLIQWGYSEELDAWVRVILVDRGETILNAYCDRSYKS